MQHANLNGCAYAWPTLHPKRCATRHAWTHGETYAHPASEETHRLYIRYFVFSTRSSTKRKYQNSSSEPHRNVAGMDADAGVDPYSDGAGSSASTYHHHHNREGQCYYEFTVYLPLSTHRTYVLSTHVVRLGCKERWQNLCKCRCKIQTTFF